VAAGPGPRPGRVATCTPAVTGRRRPRRFSFCANKAMTTGEGTRRVMGGSGAEASSKRGRPGYCSHHMLAPEADSPTAEEKGSPKDWDLLRDHDNLRPGKRQVNQGIVPHGRRADRSAMTVAVECHYLVLLACGLICRSRLKKTRSSSRYRTVRELLCAGAQHRRRSPVS
jgi:hypothetical protein